MKSKSPLPVYNTADVMQMLGVSRATIWRYMKTGQLPYRKMGKLVRFLQSDIKAFFDRNKVDSNVNLSSS